MCCDICPRYAECEEKDHLKEACCGQCPEYGYCQEDDLHNENNTDEVDGENY